MEDRIKKRRAYIRSGEIINGRKRCTKCGEEKSLSDYYANPSKGNPNCLHSVCKSCQNKRHTEWSRKEGKEISRRISQRGSWKKKGINLTQQEYDNKFKTQKGCCAICGVTQTKLNCALAVDHNHKTGKVRGLLCAKCNYVVGAIESNGYRIPKAKVYLEKWEV